MSATWVRVGVVVVAIALLVVATSTGRVSEPARCANVHVEPTTWRIEHARSLASRSPTGAEQLAADLVRCRVLVGMRGPHMRRFLGRPDEVGEASGRPSLRPDWLYQLARNRGILSKPHYLRILFGPRGTVTRAEIVLPR
jgi:hypothetical protein